MGRAGLFLAIAATGLTGCLLYTDPINARPEVSDIMTADPIMMRAAATFAAVARDPDGEPLTLRWAHLARPCAEVGAAEWAAAATWAGPTVQVTPQRRDPFCVRVVATDPHGAEAARTRQFAPGNRAPTVQMGVEPGDGPYALYTSFRLVPAGLDADQDPLQYAWTATRAGAEVPLGPCVDERERPLHRCFVAREPGTYEVRVTASDGMAQSPAAAVSLVVAEDAAPCIEASDPDLGVPRVVLDLDAPARRFEVRRVRDDGHPLPAGPYGEASFSWFVSTADGVWNRQIGFERAAFAVGPDLFEGVRPGATFGVRVMVKDPAHDSALSLREVTDGCAGRSLCEQPPRCVRWVSWEVQFR